MKTHENICNTASVRQALRGLQKTNRLEQIADGVNNLGILRGYNGEARIGLLNFALPRAKIRPFFESRALQSAVNDFDTMAASLLGSSYLLRGYVGLTVAGGAVSHLHVDEAPNRRLNVVVSSGDANASTMVYTGEQSVAHLEGEPMSDVVAQLGAQNFAQADEGQILELEATDYHGEPPLQPGTPRLFLVATS